MEFNTAHLEGYHAAAVACDVQARGGGGAAERLHASCRHIVAAAEVEGCERGEAAPSSHPHVRHPAAAEEIERLE